MLKRVLSVLALLVLVFVVYVALQPGQYVVERTKVIEAPRPVVYGILADLERFEAWSPWAGRDPDIETTITGEPGEVGAIYRWTGNDQVGEGSLEITAVNPQERIEQKLVFITPFESEAKTMFLLDDAEGGTEVTWRMEGENGFVGKLMDTVMDMEAMIGKDYEAGLAKLNEVAQAEAEKAAEEAAAEEAEDDEATSEDAEPAEAEAGGAEDEATDE